MRAGPRECVIMWRLSEVVKNLLEAMSVVCTACIYTGAVFCYVFLKFKMGMPPVCSMTTSLHEYNMLRNYSAVILALAINSLKMTQIVDFFCFAVVDRLCAKLMLK